MSEPHRKGASGPERTDPAQSGAGIDRTVGIFVHDPLLRPVLLVLVAHLAVLGMPVILGALRDRRPVALLVLLGAVWGTAAGIRGDLKRHGSPSAMSGLLGSIWLGALAVAWAAHHYGVY